VGFRYWPTACNQLKSGESDTTTSPDYLDHVLSRGGGEV
jgi:hypothetical protein